MKRIAQDIKSAQFSHLYLLYGEEAYLRRQYRDKLRAALVPADDTMNCSVYSGKDINASEVVDLAGTMPFFAERRVIIIENSGWLKSGNDQFLALVKAIPDTTYLILVEEETDKRSKLYKAVTANGYAALCEMQDEATLRKWVMGLLKKENKLITPDALTLLLDKTGTSMENIRREVEKLVCYKYYDEGITASDVEELCIVQIQNQIFDMVEADAVRQYESFARRYHDMPEDLESPNFFADKFVIWYQEEAQLEAFRRVSDKWFDCIDRGGTFREFVPYGYSKATGIQYVLNHYHLNLSDAYALGDSNNDLPMLSYVPHSIAMGNASPESLFAQVEYVTAKSSCGGIRQALEHYNFI